MFFRRLLKFYLRISVKLTLKRHHPFIIAITGNTGKTSTKEAIYAVLSGNLRLVKRSPKNFNTDIGVPLTILGLKDAQRNIVQWFCNFLRTIEILIYQRKYPRYLILELAADKPGEIQYFTKFLPVDIAVITTIGKDPVHLKFFPSRKSLIEEKASLLEALKTKSVAILNKDNQAVALMAQRLKNQPKRRVYFYGQSRGADLKISHIKTYLTEKKDIFLELTISYRKKIIRAKIKNLLGKGNAYAIGAALICGLVMGVSLKKGIKAISKHFKPIPGRLRAIKGIQDSIIIDDTYNASPLSYFNAIEVVNSLKGVTRKILVIGDMAELNQRDSQRIHQEIMEKAIGISDIILCVGPKMNTALSEIEKKRELNQFPKIYRAETNSEAVTILDSLIRSGDLILVKGAQIMRMEKIIKGIMLQPSLAKKLLVRQEKHWT